MPRGKDLARTDIERVIELVYNQGRAVKDVSMLLGIKIKAIYSILQRHRQSLALTEEQHSRKRGGNKPNILTDEHTDFIDQCLSVDCSLTTAALTRRLNDRFELRVSVSTTRRAIRKMGFTLKLIKKVPYQRNTEETIKRRHQYAMWLTGISPRLVYSNLVFIDEAGFNSGLRRNNGYSCRGFPAVRVSASARSPNLTIIGAMNGSKGVIHYSCSFSKTNDRAVIDFIQSLQAKILQDPDGCGVDPDNVIYIVCDNARIHTTRSVQNECFSETRENVQFVLKFLPAYSPFLNPIEEAWSHSKFEVRADNLSGNDTLISRVSCAMSNVTPELATAYTDHMMKFLQPCLHREPIIGESGTADQREMERYQLAQEEAERQSCRRHEIANIRNQERRLARRAAAQERRRQRLLAGRSEL